MREEQELPAGLPVERKLLCVVCRSCISRKVGEKLVWTAHYNTPEGIYCMVCYEHSHPSKASVRA